MNSQPQSIGYGVNVKDFGAVGDGVTDDTASIQNACSASKLVFFPDGAYKLSNTIQVQPGGKLYGTGMLKVRIQRAGVWGGPTFRIGQADGSVSAADCEISSMLIEQLHPNFVLGTSTSMEDRLTSEQSHIDCYGGYNSKFTDIWFQHGVYGISLYGCVITHISDIRSFGAWDNKIPAVCEQKAVIRLASSSTPGHLFCTETRIERVYIGTGAPSPPRTITVGNDVSYTGPENVGSKCAILVNACEGLSITNSYVGGCAEDCIQFLPTAITTMIRIDGVFMDECYISNIRFLPGSTPVVNVSIGPNNLFNGQFRTRNCIRAENNSGLPTVVGMNISGGIYSNVLECPIVLYNAKAATINSVTFNNYNAKHSTTNTPVISAGVFIGNLCREIHVTGGLWGGGTNDWSATNGCKWGPYFESAISGSASNIRAILGLAGGTVVGGVSQTYPA